MSNKIYHVRPNEKGHKRHDCPCDPISYKICSCEVGADCWKCGGDGVILTDFFDWGDEIMITHNIFTENYKGNYKLHYPKGSRNGTHFSP